MLQVAPNYDRPRLVTMDETLVYENIIKNRMYEDTANSFLVICGEDTQDKPIFSSASRERKRKYWVKTDIYKDCVIKLALVHDAVEHIERLKANHEYLQSTLRNDIINCPVPKKLTENSLAFEFAAGESLAEQLLEKTIRRGQGWLSEHY